MGHFMFIFCFPLFGIDKTIFRIKQSSNISDYIHHWRTIFDLGALYVEYRPERVEYALYEFFDVFQTDGNRVITTSWYCSSCMFDINFNIDLIVLFTIHPHYVKISWWSLKLMFPVARFLTAVLCVLHS